MKRILFISVMNGSPWGGSEEFWYRLAIWMAQQNYQVECCFFDWPGEKAQRKSMLQDKGCILHPLKNPKSAKNYLEKIFIKSRLKRDLKNLVQQKFDLIIISQGGLLDVTYPLFNHLLPFLKKFVIVYHNYNDLQILSGWRKRSLYNWSEAALQNIVAAERIFSAVQKIAGFNFPRGHVLKNPITIPVQARACPWPTLHNDTDYVWVVIAQLDVHRKAQDLLIKTLSSEKWKQRNWVLNLYGEGADHGLLSTLIDNLSLQDKIFLKGQSNNIEEVLKQSHVLLQITHLDAMPLSVTEAMNMARPCIVSNVGDMPLWIRDEEQGFVVPALTETMIESVLEKAWSQKDNWQQMGVNAFDMFLKKYPVPYEPYYEQYLGSLM